MTRLQILATALAILTLALAAFFYWLWRYEAQVRCAQCGEVMDYADPRIATITKIYCSPECSYKAGASIAVREEHKK